MELDAEELVTLRFVAAPMSGTEIVIAVMPTHRVRDYVVNGSAERMWPAQVSADGAAAEVTGPGVAREDFLAMELVKPAATTDAITLARLTRSPAIAVIGSPWLERVTASQALPRGMIDMTVATMVVRPIAGFAVTS
jgi:hypothetical protein